MDYYQPENVELRLDDDGVKRWYLATREGWQQIGVDGVRLEMNAEHYAVGTKITLEEPVHER